MRKHFTLIQRTFVALAAALSGVASSHAIIIDVKALYSDRYSIESVEVTNLANGASVTLEPGQTLALDSAEPRSADARLPFVDGDDVRFTARATDGEVTVITERPDDDHTVWVHFINTLDSNGNRHIVNKIGGLYYLTDIDNPDALVNKSWQRPTADDLKATSEYFNNTKLHGLRYEKRLAQDATLSRGMRAFGATAESSTTDVGNVVVSRDREANHRALIATMLGYDPDEAEPATPKPYRDGKNTLNICEKKLAFPGLNFLDGTDLSFGADLPDDAITDYTYSYDDAWDLVIPKTYSLWSGKEYIMTLYGKRDKDLQLVIYKPNDDGTFTEVKRFSFADHLDYTRYDDATWINDYPDKSELLAKYRDNISYDLTRRRYKPMQAAEAETGLCQAGEYVFVIQGCNITKINTSSGDISTSTVPDISTNARVTWAMVVYDLNGDGYDDVLAFADDEGKNELSSIVTYGSADGFTGDFIKQVIATDDDKTITYGDKTVTHSVNRLPRSVAASIVYPKGYYDSPYIYLATTPIYNCSLQEGEEEGETIITARFFRMELTDDNRNFWDGSLSKETLSNTYWDNLTYDTVPDSYVEWDYYWRSKIEPVYYGGLCSGIEPIITSNCNRAYSADLSKSNLLYCYGSGKNDIIDIHFDQFDACGEDSGIPMPTCCIIFAYGPGGANMTRYLYPCAITEIPSSDYKLWRSKNGPENVHNWRIDRNPESGNTGFASIPYRYKEGVTLEYVEHDVTASNPSIFFVLAAPPFNEYTAADGGASAASFCSKSETSGSEEKNSESKTAKGGVSVSFGLGEYFKLGSDHTLTKEWNTAFSKTSSTTYMQDYRVEGSHDGVNFSFVPVDRFTYRVCATDDPNVAVGETMQIYNMRDEQPRTSTWRLNTFNERLYGTGLPTIDNNLLPHEPGNIGSYRHIKPDFTTEDLCKLFDIEESDLIGYTPTDINPGDAGRSTVQISIANGNGQSAGGSFTNDLQISFGFNLGSVFGLSAKGGTSETTAWSRTTTWSETTAMGGVVPAVKDVDYQYLCRQVFYRCHIKDDTGKDMQDYLVNNWVVVGNETANNHLMPELTINGITEVGDGIYTVDLTLSGRKDLPSAPGTADTQVSKIGLDHFMLENTIDGTAWYDANTTIVDGEAKQESFDLSNEGAYDQYEATLDFKHDYLILSDEQLAQLEDYSAGVSETPVVATYRLTVSDAVGNYKNVTAQVEIPKTGNVGITDIDATRELRATATNGGIHVSGAAPLSEVRVCDIAGRPVAVVVADATGHATISGVPHGVVLVTNATGIAKLHVK